MVGFSSGHYENSIETSGSVSTEFLGKLSNYQQFGTTGITETFSCIVNLRMLFVVPKLKCYSKVPF
jgi:hypothetical protein